MTLLYKPEIAFQLCETFIELRTVEKESIEIKAEERFSNQCFKFG